MSPVCRPHSRSFTCCPPWRTTAVFAPSLSPQTPAAAPQTTRPITTLPRRAACQQEQKSLLNSPSSPSVPSSHLPPQAWKKRKTRRTRRMRSRAMVLQRQKEKMKRRVVLLTSLSGQSRNVAQGSLRIKGHHSLFHRIKVKWNFGSAAKNA